MKSLLILFITSWDSFSNATDQSLLSKGEVDLSIVEQATVPGLTQPRRSMWESRLQRGLGNRRDKRIRIDLSYGQWTCSEKMDAGVNQNQGFAKTIPLYIIPPGIIVSSFLWPSQLWSVRSAGLGFPWHHQQVKEIANVLAFELEKGGVGKIICPTLNFEQI